MIAKEWSVGLRLTKIHDPVIHKAIEVALWYSTLAAAKEEQIGPAMLRVALNAEPIKSMRGLALISHGFSGSFLGHNDMAQFLAQNGYVVVTPTHPDRQGLATQQPGLDPLVLRPRQIRLVLNEVLNDQLFKTTLPRDRVGSIGYSLGSHTALVTIGAKPDVNGLAAYCVEKADEHVLCSAGANRRFAAIGPHLVAQADSRIKGAVLLTPAYGPLFRRESLTNIAVPVQL